MVSVFDVAKYILQKKGKMSTWKLQKLCYYCQAWHMAWTEQRLIEERFEAWANGPVCPDLFHAHRGKFMITAQDLPKGRADILNADEIESIDIVLYCRPPGFTVVSLGKYLAGGLQSGCNANLTGVQYK